MSFQDIRRKVQILTLLYIAALSLVAILALTSYFIVHRKLEAREQDGAIINLAGKQSMLAERLARTAIALALDRDPEKIRVNLESMRVSLKELRESHARLVVSSMNTEEIDHIYAENERYFRSLSGSTAAILTNSGDGSGRLPSIEDEQLRILRESRPHYQAGMERILGLYEEHSRERIVGLQQTETICVSLLILTLILEGAFIFKPLTAVIDRTFKNLISARHEVEEKNGQLDFALLEAQTSAKAREIFLATMSHEIRTPMNGVIGMTSLLLDTPLTRDQRDLVQTIRISGDALLHVINDILDFTKIQSGKMELEMIPFDLSQCIEDTLDILAPLALSKHLDLSYNLEDGVPQHVIGDPYRLRQVLINLVGNALKFTTEGEVAVECSLAEATPLIAGTTIRLCIAVRDTGIGIPEDGLGRLFESFTQMDATTTRKHGGTGLGLAISKRLSELMGGDIDVISDVGEGSTFILRLPFKIAEMQTERSLLSFLQVIRDKLILIVDDNPTNLKIFDRLCRKWEARTRIFRAPREALAWFRENRPDLVLTDMFMPEMDGLHFAEELRRAEAERYAERVRVPIVLASSGGYHSEDPRCAAVELSARLTKPVRIRSLLQALAEALTTTDTQPHSITPAPGAPSTDFARKNPHRLLLVEDNKLNQKVALRLLASLGYSADVAEDGYAAIDACRQKSYNLVFMDIQMPNLDGFAATRMIQREMGDSAPRIVAMTANAMEDTRGEVTEAGMSDYVSKPIRMEELKRVLSREVPSR